MSGKTTSRKVIITTHGESATFIVKVSEDKNSLDFYCKMRLQSSFTRS